MMDALLLRHWQVVVVALALGNVVGNVLASFAHLRSTRDRDWAARFVEFIRASDYRQRRDGNIVYLAPMRGREALIV